jgi:Pectate lyase superfamily protein
MGKSRFSGHRRISFLLSSAIFALLLQGCSQEASLSSVSPSAPSVPPTSTAPVIPPSAPPPVVPPGSVLQAVPVVFSELSGCLDPNGGIPAKDWGSLTLAYTDPQTINLQVNPPQYSENEIFWISRETRPGQSILVTGAFTDLPKSARLALIPEGTTDWQSIVRNSQMLVPATQQGTTGLSFIVPATFPQGVYGFQIEDPSAPPILREANLPFVTWVIGVPSVHDLDNALKHQIHNCGVEPGGTLRIFGKNFLPSTRVMLQSTAGAVWTLNPEKQDSNSISAVVPALLEGSYNMWVGTSQWDQTSSPATKITVYPVPYSTIRYANCSAMVGDGKTDNTALLQSCLDHNAPTSSSSEIVVLRIGIGQFVIKTAVTAHSYEVLAGSSATDTILIAGSLFDKGGAWFTVPENFGMANISLRGPASASLLSAGTNAHGTGHLYLDNVDFERASNNSSDSSDMLILSGVDIQIYDSHLHSDFGRPLYIVTGNGAMLSGNDFELNNAWIGIQDTQNLIFENNQMHNSILHTQWPEGKGQAGVLSISRGFHTYGPSRLSQNIYTGYNLFHDLDSTAVSVITTDGGGGAYYGPVASSTDTSVVLANDPGWWESTGTTNYLATSIAIIYGKGVGQYSLIKSVNGRTIDLVTPWKVLPDSSSIVDISDYELNLTFANNTFKDNRGKIMDLWGMLEGVIEDNSLTNSGDGILIEAYAGYGGPADYTPAMNIDIIRNSLLKGDGDLIRPSIHSNKSGLGVFDQPGCLVSGVLIRDNIVPSSQAMYSTNGMMGVSAVLIEQNLANWIDDGKIPGFLVQDNVPQ